MRVNTIFFQSYTLIIFYMVSELQWSNDLFRSCFSFIFFKLQSFFIFLFQAVELLLYFLLSYMLPPFMFMWTSESKPLSFLLFKSTIDPESKPSASLYSCLIFIFIILKPLWLHFQNQSLMLLVLFFLKPWSFLLFISPKTSESISSFC